MYMYLYLLPALGRYHAIDTLCIERIHALATTLPTSRKVGVTSIIKVAAFKWDFANCSSSKIGSHGVVSLHLLETP